MILSSKWQAHVQKLPETGMGYHYCDVTLKDGTVHQRTLILNGVDLSDIGIYPTFTVDDILSIEMSHVSDGQFIKRRLP